MRAVWSDQTGVRVLDDLPRAALAIVGVLDEVPRGVDRAGHGVRLLCYGTLQGGLMAPRWLGVPEPDSAAISDWSKMKYKRFIDAAGGWDVFQGLLDALARIARRHGVSIANVATRWVLDHPAVVGVERCTGAETIIAATAKARGLLCPAEEINYLSGPGKGVILIKLGDDDKVLGFIASTGDRGVERGPGGGGGCSHAADHTIRTECLYRDAGCYHPHHEKTRHAVQRDFVCRIDADRQRAETDRI